MGTDLILPQTKYRAADSRPRLLLFNGHLQHLIFNVLKICKKRYLIWSFDDKPFPYCKDYRKLQYNTWVCPQDADTEISDFFDGFDSVRKEGLNPQIVKDALSDSGIILFDRFSML